MNGKNRVDVRAAATPFYAVDLRRLEDNLRVLERVKARTGCGILLALKAFAMWRTFPLLRTVLDGVCASSPFEARLGREEFGGEVHAFAPAYSEADIRRLLPLCDCIVFNSFSQWDRHRGAVQASPRPVACGLRINPEFSTAEVPLYDPCAPRSRLGIRRRDFEGRSLEGISGLHFHTLCEQGADALEATLEAVKAAFGGFLPRMSWLNLGGGHHITRAGYDLDRLCRLVLGLSETFGVRVHLEPGEAVALDAGVLVSSVLDVTDNDGAIAVLDCSCTAHMPDVLEMPYRPRVRRAGDTLAPETLSRAGAPGEKPFTYRLGGLSCLAGDVIGDYSFDDPLAIGDRLLFEDMAIYSMVKSTMFNGVQHPALALYDRAGNVLEIARQFGYEDFKSRLG